MLYYWPYGHHGINFHPPLAGQLNLAAHAVFGHWMKDIPARRMASVIEFALTITIGFHFLSRRYGEWVGLVMAGSLLFMPRLYGQAHLIDTDTPGLLLWAATALAFWKGLHEPGARRWRVAVGILLGLAFVEKMGAVMVLLPLLLWLVVGHLPRSFARPGGRFDWIDGTLTTGAMLAPLGLAFQQIQILQQQLPPPAVTNLFVHRPASDWPGAILAIPLAVWFVRRLLGWFFPEEQGLGGRAAGTRDLDGHPGLCSGRRLAGQPGLVARNAPAARPLLHAERRPRTLASATSRSSTSVKSTNSASPGIMPGS